MATSPVVRLRALFLTAVFLAGSAGTATVDIIRHHQDRADQHDGRHVELPGSCLDHQHQCDLGLSVGGTKLLSSSGSTFASPGAMVRSTVPAAFARLRSDRLFHLPPTRAPPGLS